MKRLPLTCLGLLALGGRLGRRLCLRRYRGRGEIPTLPAPVSQMQVKQGPNELCTAVSKADTPAQRLITLGDPTAQPPIPPSVDVIYRKVVNHLVVEMDAAEKQQVDNAAAVDAAVKQQYTDEIKTKDMCKEDLLAQVTQFLANREQNKHADVTASETAAQSQIATSQTAFQAEIDAMSVVNLAVAKAMFTKVNELLHAIVATKANQQMHQLVHNDINDEYVLVNNVARCLLAARKTKG